MNLRPAPISAVVLEREANERYASYDDRAGGVNASKRQSEDVEGFALWSDEGEMKGRENVCLGLATELENFHQVNS